MTRAIKTVAAGYTLIAGTIAAADRAASFIPMYPSVRDRTLDIVFGPADSFEFMSITTPADPLKLDQHPAVR